MIYIDYEILITEPLLKKLYKFDKETERRFYNKIEKLKTFPDIYGKPLNYPLAGKWELYFEKSWRIIFIIDEVKKQVTVEAIWHKDDF